MASEEEVEKGNKDTYGVEPEKGDYTWLQQPAIFSDYCAVGLWNKVGLVRFAFCEWLANGTTPLVRTGIVMPISDAKDLAKEILRLIEEMEAPPPKAEVGPKDG